MRLLGPLPQRARLLGPLPERARLLGPLPQRAAAQPSAGACAGTPCGGDSGVETGAPASDLRA